MEAVDNKYKRWGWGALIGLGVVLLIAVIVIAVSSKNTPIKTVEGSDESTQAVANNPSNSGNKNNGGNNSNGDEGRDNEGDAKKEGAITENNGGANSGNTNNGTNNGSNGSNGSNNSGNNSNNANTNNASGNSNMPKTGPEDDMIAFIAWAVIAGLGAYYVLGLKK